MATTTTSTAAARPPRSPPPLPPPPPPHPQNQTWHATYEDYLDRFLTSDDAFFFDGDLDTARALVEAGLRARGGAGGAPLSRRAWTHARLRALRSSFAAAPSSSLNNNDNNNNNKTPPTTHLLSNPALLPASECPLLSLLAERERAVRSGSLAVVVFLRARNAAGQEVSAYVDLAARLGVVVPDGEDDDDRNERHQQQPFEDEDDNLSDDGDEDAAERRAAAANRRARDASSGVAGVFARVRPFVPLPTDLCYYNHATRRARANPTAQWQLMPAFGDGDGEGEGEGDDDDDDDDEDNENGGGRLLLRHVRDRRVLDVSAPPYGGDAPSGRTVVDLGPVSEGAGAGGGGGGGKTTAPSPSPLLLSERSYLLQAVVFDHVVRRR